MGTGIHFAAALAVVTVIALPSSPTRASFFPNCVKILRDYVGLPALAGASEAFGAYMFDLIVQKNQDTPSSPPPPSSPQQVAPPAEFDEGYFNYLMAQGVSECELRTSMERFYGPPPAKRYNQD
jgi:hypothetical protein